MSRNPPYTKSWPLAGTDSFHLVRPKITDGAVQEEPTAALLRTGSITLKGKSNGDEEVIKIQLEDSTGQIITQLADLIFIQNGRHEMDFPENQSAWVKDIWKVRIECAFSPGVSAVINLNYEYENA
jgi:hypothetical protein